MASEQEKIAYIEEHLSYEIVMLNYTFMRVLTLRPLTPEEQLDCNAFLNRSPFTRGTWSIFFLRGLERIAETLLTTSLTSRHQIKRG